MIKPLALLFLFMVSCISIAQVGIGTTTPHKSSILEVSSTTKGFLVPRMNESKMQLINAPAEGLMVYCTDCCVDGRLAFFTNSWTFTSPCPVPNNAPVVTNLTITGSTTEDEILTANFDYADTESDLAGAHTYKWYHSDNVNGLNRTLITGATNSTYTLKSSDVNKFIQFSVIPKAATGTSPGLELTSGYTGAVQATVPVVIVIPSGNFSSGGNKSGGQAHHPNDVDYPTLFNGNTTTDDNRFHEGDYIKIDFSTLSTPVLLPTGCKIKVYWYHENDNKYWGVYASFYNGATLVNNLNDGPYNTYGERVLTLISTGQSNIINVGAIDNSQTDGGHDARIREIVIEKPDGTVIDITVTP